MPGGGEELDEREGVIAGIMPEGTPAAAADWSDFAAMHKEILKNRFQPRADIVSEEPGRY